MKNYFFSNLFSKQVLGASIGALVLIFGYVYTSNNQQNLEKLKIKAVAYTNFLNEFLADDHQYNPQKLNRALINLYIYAPDCVIRKINESFSFSGGTAYLSGIEGITKMTLILHDDMQGQLRCDKSGTLKRDDLPLITSIIIEK